MAYGVTVRKLPHPVTRFFRAFWCFSPRLATRVPSVAGERGAMRLSQYFLPLLRENPSEAQI
ncbi:MAG TPA: hypothetical protein VNF04_11215, partial [Stellaceae bacterium]|nr:hypothetical protein [Stellaceae bacterium]